MVFEADWEVRSGVVHNDVFPVRHSVWIVRLTRNEFGKFVVADTGLAKVYHCSVVSGLNKVHLGQKSKSCTQAVSCSVNRVAGIEVFEAGYFRQHVLKNFALWLLEAIMDRASFALRVGLPVNSDYAHVCDKILNIRGASKNNVDRFSGG